MSDAVPISMDPWGVPESRLTSGAKGRSWTSIYEERVAELERENSRLHRLVAELLMKNQQLRTAE